MSRAGKLKPTRKALSERLVQVYGGVCQVFTVDRSIEAGAGMPFIRLSDNYIDNPKFTALSDGAFRLWHEGMAFCRRHETDGVLTVIEVQGFRYFRQPRVLELLRPARDGKNPLWETVPHVGYLIHNYLEWNLSKDEAAKERDGATQRMRAFRRRRGSDPPSVTPFVTPAVTALVPDRDTERIGSPENGSRSAPARADVDQRAARLLDAYAVWYAKHRHGAKLRLLHNNLEFQDACSLCALWDDARLEKLATVVLTTDEEFIGNTDRSFRIFVLKASWADDRLRQAESGAV